MPCRDEKIDGKIIQLEEDIMNILNDAKLAVFNSYQSPSSNSSVLKWSQGNDENDPDKRNCIYSDPSHMRKRENVEETACRRHEMIWRWSYEIKRNQKKKENSFKK